MDVYVVASLKRLACERKCQFVHQKNNAQTPSQRTEHIAHMCLDVLTPDMCVLSLL